jgi:hypothetical protein
MSPMDSSLVLYVPPLPPYYLVPIMVLSWVLLIRAFVSNKNNDPVDVWTSTGRYFYLDDPESLPNDMCDAAIESGAHSVELFEREYSSGKMAWRFMINGRYYYPSRTLVRLRS